MPARPLCISPRTSTRREGSPHDCPAAGTTSQARITLPPFRASRRRCRSSSRAAPDSPASRSSIRRRTGPSRCAGRRARRRCCGIAAQRVGNARAHRAASCRRAARHRLRGIGRRAEPRGLLWCRLLRRPAAGVVRSRARPVRHGACRARDVSGFRRVVRARVLARRPDRARRRRRRRHAAEIDASSLVAIVEADRVVGA